MTYIFAVAFIACVLALDSPSVAPAACLIAGLSWIVLMVVIANYVRHNKIAPVQKEKKKRRSERKWEKQREQEDRRGRKRSV